MLSSNKPTVSLDVMNDYEHQLFLGLHYKLHFPPRCHLLFQQLENFMDDSSSHQSYIAIILLSQFD